MSCEGIRNDGNYNVVVKVPQSLRARCGATWTLFRRVICIDPGLYGYDCVAVCMIFLFLFVGFGLFLLILTIVQYACQFSPTLLLEELSIRDMTVYQSNVTIAAPGLPWQVDSGFNVTLHTRNRNTLAGCFTTFRTITVDVRYKDEHILHQEIPLRFKLKPNRSRPVVVELKGDHVPLKKELGPVMEAELRSGNISLEFHFNTRYSRNDRKAVWLNMACRVVTKTPSNPSQVGGSLVWKECKWE